MEPIVMRGFSELRGSWKRNLKAHAVHGLDVSHRASENPALHGEVFHQVTHIEKEVAAL